MSQSFFRWDVTDYRLNYRSDSYSSGLWSHSPLCKQQQACFGRMRDFFWEEYYYTHRQNALLLFCFLFFFYTFTGDFNHTVSQGDIVARLVMNKGSLVTGFNIALKEKSYIVMLSIDHDPQGNECETCLMNADPLASISPYFFTWFFKNKNKHLPCFYGLNGTSHKWGMSSLGFAVIVFPFPFKYGYSGRRRTL